MLAKKLNRNIHTLINVICCVGSVKIRIKIPNIFRLKNWNTKKDLRFTHFDFLFYSLFYSTFWRRAFARNVRLKTRKFWYYMNMLVNLHSNCFHCHRLKSQDILCIFFSRDYKKSFYIWLESAPSTRRAKVGILVTKKSCPIQEKTFFLIRNLRF